MNYPFLFARKERKGLYLLLLLSVIFIGGKFYFFPAPVFESSMLKVQSTKFAIPEIRVYKIPEYLIDPNALKASDWLAMGLDATLAARIEKYTSKGGHFYEAKDLLKMYGMDTSFYKKVECKIQIAPKEKREFEKHVNPSKAFVPHERKVKALLEVNAATQEQLIELDGIGDKLAARIIKYRDMLGGFVSKQQLRKVYGMDSVNYNKIQSQITVDPLLVKRVAVNTATAEELSKVKFVGVKRAKAIVAYRESHGDFSSLKDLLKTQVVNDSILYLIEPYILLNDIR
ncbi:MAG: helix-hairpin-helix domain-containing protein [Bacteroidetes bacterium]|nr:helix-hairpin-helix domain-containing protein [Bacteroidota bacterium]